MKRFCENQVPWPAGKPKRTDRKNGPFKVNLLTAAKRVFDAVAAFTKAGQHWRSVECWIYVQGAQIGAQGQFLANQRGVLDPAVVVTFDIDKKQYSVCADRYSTPEQNLAGIAAYIESIRAQERNGIFEVEEMLHSFAALPAVGTTWWRTELELSPDATLEDAEASFVRLTKRHHPDLPGSSSSDMQAKLNEAIAEARMVLK